MSWDNDSIYLFSHCTHCHCWFAYRIQSDQCLPKSPALTNVSWCFVWLLTVPLGIAAHDVLPFYCTMDSAPNADAWGFDGVGSTVVTLIWLMNAASYSANNHYLLLPAESDRMRMDSASMAEIYITYRAGFRDSCTR